LTLIFILYNLIWLNKLDNFTLRHLNRHHIKEMVINFPFMLFKTDLGKRKVAKIRKTITQRLGIAQPASKKWTGQEKLRQVGL
jgi:hypothetical protein